MNKHRAIYFLPLILTACGGGGSTGLVDDDPSGSLHSDLCRNEALDAIEGAWDGQVRYEGRRGMCLWEVEAIVGGEVTAACERPGALTASVIQAEPVEGEVCGEVGIAADWMTTSDQVPSGVLAVFDVGLEDGPIYPNGLAGFGSNSVEFVVTRNATLEFSAGSDWSGVLVRE